MARFRCKLHLTKGAYGWSETYNCNAADYAAADLAFKAIITLRMATLWTDVLIEGATISDTDVKGDSMESTTADTVGTFVTGPPTGSFNPNWALRILFNAGLTIRANRFIHALPDNVVDVDGVYAPTAAFTTALSAYRAGLVGGFCAAKKIAGATSAPFETFTQYTGSTLKTARSRKVGRPFLVPPGRRTIA